MKRVFTMKGIVYSDNKVRIKGLMKTYGLKWVGSLYNAIWKSDSETVIAKFERENGVTVEVVLSYSGPGDTEFIDQFTKFLLHLGAEGHDESVKSEIKDIENLIKAEMSLWDIMNKPNVDMMRRGTVTCPRGAPESFIEAALKDYDKKRVVKVAQVREQLMKDFNLTGEKKKMDNMTKDDKEQMTIEDILGK